MDWKSLDRLTSGYKTHGAAIAIGLLAAAAWACGEADTQQALRGILEAFALSFLRQAIARLPGDQQESLARAIKLVDSLRVQLAPNHELTSYSIGNRSHTIVKPAESTPSPEPLSIAPQPTSRDVGGIAGLLIALTCGSVWAGDAMIAGPAAVPAPGYPCRLFIQGDLPAETAIGWDVSPRREGVVQIRPATDGLSADLTTLAGAWKIAVAIHEPGRAIYFRYFDVQVPGQPYTPPPGPTPEPQPAPQPEPRPAPSPDPPTPTPEPPRPPQPTPAPLPAGEFGVAEKVAAIVRTIDSPKRGAEAAQLADAAEALAAQIAAGAVTNVTEVLPRIGGGIKGLSSPAWSAVAGQFATAMEQTWKAHSTGRLKLTAVGGLVDKPAWATLLREIAIGLRSVK